MSLFRAAAGTRGTNRSGHDPHNSVKTRNPMLCCAVQKKIQDCLFDRGNMGVCSSSLTSSIQTTERHPMPHVRTRGRPTLGGMWVFHLLRAFSADISPDRLISRSFTACLTSRSIIEYCKKQAKQHTTSKRQRDKSKGSGKRVCVSVERKACLSSPLIRVLLTCRNQAGTQVNTYFVDKQASFLRW